MMNRSLEPEMRHQLSLGRPDLALRQSAAEGAADTGVRKAADSGRVTVRVIRTDEELMIAKTVCGVLGLGMTSEKSAAKGS